MLCAIERTSVPAVDRGLQVRLRSPLAGVPSITRQIDVQARGNRSLRLVEDRLEVLGHDQVGKERLTLDVVRIGLLEEHDRVGVQDVAGLAPVGRRLLAEDVAAGLEAGRLEHADLPIAHDEESGIAVGHHVGRGVIVTAGNGRIHVLGDHEAHLIERLDHLRAAQRGDGVVVDCTETDIHEGLLEQVKVLAVDDDFEGRGIGPVSRQMGEADLAGGDDLVASGVEFGPGLRHFLHAGRIEHSSCSPTAS